MECILAVLDEAHCQRLAKIEENARNRYANHVSGVIIDHPTQKPNCLSVRVELVVMVIFNKNLVQTLKGFADDREQ